MASVQLDVRSSCTTGRRSAVLAALNGSETVAKPWIPSPVTLDLGRAPSRLLGLIASNPASGSARTAGPRRYVSHGPHPIGAKRPIVVPSQVMKDADLHPGDGVYFEVLDDPAGCVLMIPVEVAERWWQAGKTAVQDRLADPRSDER